MGTIPANNDPGNACFRGFIFGGLFCTRLAGCPPDLTHPRQKKRNWGGRIRTLEWRDQNPLPYRLATPQRLGAL